MDRPTSPLPRPPRSGARGGRWPVRIAGSTARLGAFGLTAAIAIGQCSPATSCTPAAPPPAVAVISGPAQAVVDLTNQQRGANGLAPVAVDQALVNAAQAHSADQAAMDTMSHTGSDGSNTGQRLDRQGYVWSRWGENVATGYGDASSVMAGWMGSPGHRANILNASLTQVGVGLAYSANGTPYWTQVFATPR
ncbi:MAG: CAP domain-containing protein [Ilumatobacteraceae bacterium]